MKNNLLTSLLVGLLVLSALAVSALSFSYVRYKQKLHRLQTQVALINQQRSAMQSLANEAVEYSRRNPDLEPILREIGIRPRPSRNSPSPAPPAPPQP